jgi:hypothetical protein
MRTVTHRHFLPSWVRGSADHSSARVTNGRLPNKCRLAETASSTARVAWPTSIRTTACLEAVHTAGELTDCI